MTGVGPLYAGRMRDVEYQPDQIPAYGAVEQPAIAARMAPHLRMVVTGAVAAVVAVVCALIAVLLFPTFSADDTGRGWGIVTLVAAVAMLAVAVIQLAVWRRALDSWRGKRVQDLHGEARLSWVAHLVSYAVALIALFGAIAGSGAAGWSSRSAALLAVALLFVLVAQVSAGVQYLRAEGPPGTLPAHMRRLVERSRAREDEDD